MRSFEYLSTCCVPYGDVVRAPLFHVKGPSNGADGLLEFPLHVPVEQRCLPHVHVSQQDHLDVGFLHFRHLGHGGDEDDDDDNGLSRSTEELFVLSPHQKRSSLAGGRYHTENFERCHCYQLRFICNIATKQRLVNLWFVCLNFAEVIQIKQEVGLQLPGRFHPPRCLPGSLRNRTILPLIRFKDSRG